MSIAVLLPARGQTKRNEPKKNAKRNIKERETKPSRKRNATSQKPKQNITKSKGNIRVRRGIMIKRNEQPRTTRLDVKAKIYTKTSSARRILTRTTPSRPLATLKSEPGTENLTGQTKSCTWTVTQSHNVTK